MAFQRLSDIGHKMSHEVLPRAVALGLAVGLCTTPQVVEAIEAKASLQTTQDNLEKVREDFNLSQDEVVKDARELTASCYDELRENTPHNLDSETTVDGILGVAEDTDSLGPCNLNPVQRLTAVTLLIKQREYDLMGAEVSDAYHEYASAKETWEQAPREIRLAALEGLVAIVTLGSLLRLRKWLLKRREVRRHMAIEGSSGLQQENSLDSTVFVEQNG